MNEKQLVDSSAAPFPQIQNVQAGLQGKHVPRQHRADSSDRAAEARAVVLTSDHAWRHRTPVGVSRHSFRHPAHWLRTVNVQYLIISSSLPDHAVWRRKQWIIRQTNL